MTARRYWLAVLLAVTGVVLGVACALGGEAASSAHAAGFVRAAVPGQVSVRVDRPATLYVYAEGTLWKHPTVAVTGPDGRAVALQADTVDSSSLLGASARAAIATFDARVAGTYVVAMSTGSAVQGEFSVGDRFAWWMRLADVVAYGLVLVGVGAGIVLAGVTMAQRRRPVSGGRSPTGR